MYAWCHYRRTLSQVLSIFPKIVYIWSESLPSLRHVFQCICALPPRWKLTPTPESHVVDERKHYYIPLANSPLKPTRVSLAARAQRNYLPHSIDVSLSVCIVSMTSGMLILCIDAGLKAMLFFYSDKARSICFSFTCMKIHVGLEGTLELGLAGIIVRMVNKKYLYTWV